MKLTRITSADNPLFKKATELYRIGFPLHEQRESAAQIKILSDGAYRFDVACEVNNFVGEILYWEFENFVYVEHFCVEPSMRNKGYGQKILSLLPKKTLILEIDPPKNEISLRRKGFYERCGFVENPFRHIHPPYKKGNSGHTLVVMSSPRALTGKEYDEFFKTLVNIVMSDENI